MCFESCRSKHALVLLRRFLADGWEVDRISMRCSASRYQDTAMRKTDGPPPAALDRLAAYLAAIADMNSAQARVEATVRT